MSYPSLDLARYTRTTHDINNSIVVDVLKNSKGQPTMSDEDVKLAILSLLHTCERQQTLIDELVNCVNALREPKKKFKIFKK